MRDADVFQTLTGTDAFNALALMLECLGYERSIDNHGEMVLYRSDTPVVRSAVVRVLPKSKYYAEVRWLDVMADDAWMLDVCTYEEVFDKLDFVRKRIGV